MSVDISRYHGVIPVFVTPCRGEGIVDAAAVTRLCGLMAEKGCAGAFALGSTGQLTLLSEDDRRTIVRSARAGLGGDRLLYAGITSLGLTESLRSARHAAEDGADIAVLMAPFFLRISQEQLYAYASRIADASPLPVALYHHLAMPTGFDVETIGRLAQHGNIVAIKDTSNDIDRVRALLTIAAGGEFAVFQGHEALMKSSFQAGARGCVSALAGIVPEWYVALLDAVRNGRDVEADAIQARIDTLTGMFATRQTASSISYFAYSIKLGLRRRGWLEHLDDILPGMKRDPDFESMVRAIQDRADVPRLQA